MSLSPTLLTGANMKLYKGYAFKLDGQVPATTVEGWRTCPNGYWDIVLIDDLTAHHVLGHRKIDGGHCAVIMTVDGEIYASQNYGDATT